MATNIIQQNNAPLRSSEAMQRLGYRSRTSFYQAVYAQGIPHLRITSRRIVFPRAELEAWIASRTAGRAA